MTAEQDTKLIYQLLRERRAELNQYQTTAADEIGVSRNQYRQWESGHAVPGDKWIEPLMAYLDMAEDDLVMTLSRSRRAREREVVHVMSSCVNALRAHRSLSEWFPRPIDFLAEHGKVAA